MKKIIFLIMLNAILSACVQSANPDINSQTKRAEDALSDQQKKSLNNLLSLSQAEKILGEPANLTDSSTLFSINRIIFLT